MKKLFLIATLCVAGLVSAKENSTNSFTKRKLSEGGYYTLTVKTSCGKNYSQKIWCDTPPTQSDVNNMGLAVNYAECGTTTGYTAKAVRCYDVN